MTFFKRHEWQIALFILTVFLIIFSVIATRAQAPKSWLIWKYNPGLSYPLAQVYKIQDGNCSIYVAHGYPGNIGPVAIATGQGCK